MRRPVAASVALALAIVTAALVGAPVAIAATGAAEADAAAAVSADTSSSRAAAVVAAAQQEDDPGNEPNEADMVFAAMMIPHHAQAVELSRILAATTGIDDTSVALAAFIERDQSLEIERMQAWLDAWHGAGVLDHAHTGTMAGMATAEQIARLDALDGVAAERLFLELMIAHHEGALAMTRDVIDAGVNTWIRVLAKHVAAEQQREIEAMTARLGTL
ncbi:hypothetical protein GCM10025760_24460 [Microbacterium yannicii]|uniref:DUF305 domain-containing protein n=1 Tax=Microbacterium yannicii TaxID=671622 RepID=A0ABP9MFC4_9MICO|nr:DUF305 domain-containing protein [Microbacterium yannicii]MCO5952827.1 DUF305 domain-containing protein [Microbacterium yannicii]